MSHLADGAISSTGGTSGTPLIRARGAHSTCVRRNLFAGLGPAHNRSYSQRARPA